MELTHQPLIYLFNHVLDNDVQKCIDNFILFEVKQAKEKSIILILPLFYLALIVCIIGMVILAVQLLSEKDKTRFIMVCLKL